MNRFRLRAIRLVGFHNFADELIQVDGDLFVIGSNESGKTTILDALHLAISGGQHLDFNAGVIRLNEKLGFKHDGRLRDDQFREGKYVDSVIMSILAEEWESSHGAD